MEQTVTHSAAAGGLGHKRDVVASYHPAPVRETAFDRPRDFLGNRFVYAVISARAHGLSVGVNVNPDQKCNFDCSYCEVNRRHPARETKLDVEVMAAELRKTISFIRSGRLIERPNFHALPPELLQLRQVALSGDGEPTLAPNFVEAVQAVVRVLHAHGQEAVLAAAFADMLRAGLQVALGQHGRHDALQGRIAFLRHQRPPARVFARLRDVLGMQERYLIRRRFRKRNDARV